MRVFISNWNVRQIEKDSQVSKYSYGSRKQYLIEIALLEKRLIYDASMWMRVSTIYIMTDLAVCCN